MRLKARKNFPLALDDKSKNFIWKTICTNDAIEMYLLEEPRPPLVNYNRYDNLDPELEIICEPVIRKHYFIESYTILLIISGKFT